MMGLHFMGDVPFRRVLLHGMVVDEQGQKMSKVTGNVIDPLDLVHGSTFDEVVQKALPGAPLSEALAKFRKSYPSTAQMGSGFPAFGADALRFTLASYSPQARRIALAPKRIEGYRHFCNKIWNATRFAMPNFESATLPADGGAPEATSRHNRWILSRLAQTIEEATESLENFRLDEATSTLYHFFWYDLCDWYLELTKPVFYGDDEAAKEETAAVLAHTLETSLRALHPFIPYITEDLWHRIPRPSSRPISIALAPWPTAEDGRKDAEADREMAAIQAAISAARTVRSEHEVHPGASVPLVLRAPTPELRKLLEEELVAIRTLVKTDGEPKIEASGGERPRGSVMNVAGEVEVLVGLIGLVDAKKEGARIERELKKLEKDLQGLERRLSSPKFVEKAPQEVVAEAKEQRDALLRKRGQLEEAKGIAEELG